MKKILLTFIILLLVPSFAIKAATKSDYDAFILSLKLNQAQKAKIEKIEKEANTKIARLHGQILLKQMEGQKFGHSLEANDKIKELQKESYAIQKQKEKDIAAVLPWLKRRRYLEYCSRVY